MTAVFCSWLQVAPPVAQSLVSLGCTEEQGVSPFARCQPQLATDKVRWMRALKLQGASTSSRGCSPLCPGPVSFRKAIFFLEPETLVGDKEKKVKLAATFHCDFVLLGPQQFLNINHEPRLESIRYKLAFCSNQHCMGQVGTKHIHPDGGD